MVAKAVLAIGIGVAVILFIGPLGTLGPGIIDFFTPDDGTITTPGTGAQPSGASPSVGARTAESGDDTSAARSPTDGDGRAARQGDTGDAGNGDTGSDADAPSDGSTDGSKDDGTSTPGTDDGSRDTDSRDDKGEPRPSPPGQPSPGQDPAPAAEKSGAFVRVMASKFTIEEDYTAMLAVILSPITGSISPNTQVARATVDLAFENIGDDFTTFVKFDGVMHVDGLEVKRVNSNIGLLSAGEKVNRQFTYTVKVSDIPPEVINRIARHVVEGSHPVFSFEIKNIDFERK